MVASTPALLASFDLDTSSWRTSQRCLVGGLDRVLGDLAALGYDAEWHCIPASAVGAPHRRDRVWIVAYPARHECAQWTRWAVASMNELGRPATASEALWPTPQAHDLHARVTSRRVVGRFGTKAGHGMRNLNGRGSEVSNTMRPRLSVRSQAHWERPEGNASNLNDKIALEVQWWATEPDVGRVAHGVPVRVDRLRALGNAVVPQIPQIIGEAIMAAETQNV
jgi:DNA (cytosine-5)-methyltransferase 1